MYLMKTVKARRMIKSFVNFNYSFYECVCVLKYHGTFGGSHKCICIMCALQHTHTPITFYYFTCSVIKIHILHSPIWISRILEFYRFQSNCGTILFTIRWLVWILKRFFSRVCVCVWVEGGGSTASERVWVRACLHLFLLFVP